MSLDFLVNWINTVLLRVVTWAQPACPSQLRDWKTFDAYIRFSYLYDWQHIADLNLYLMTLLAICSMHYELICSDGTGVVDVEAVCSFRPRCLGWQRMRQQCILVEGEADMKNSNVPRLVLMNWKRRGGWAFWRDHWAAHTRWMHTRCCTLAAAHSLLHTRCCTLLTTLNFYTAGMDIVLLSFFCVSKQAKATF